MITRSLGISPGLPWGGPLPGGGYDGKTKRLDRAVQRFAEWLHRRIAGPVQVRFNSHRLSGGAFVYPGLDAAAAEITFDTPEIGLGARLITPASVQRRRDRAWNKGEGSSLPALEWEDCWTESTPLSYNVLVYPAVSCATPATWANTSRATGSAIGASGRRKRHTGYCNDLS